jgi:hypothetical protein
MLDVNVCVYQKKSKKKRRQLKKERRTQLKMSIWMFDYHMIVRWDCERPGLIFGLERLQKHEQFRYDNTDITPNFDREAIQIGQNYKIFSAREGNSVSEHGFKGQVLYHGPKNLKRRQCWFQFFR